MDLAYEFSKLSLKDADAYNSTFPINNFRFQLNQFADNLTKPIVPLMKLPSFIKRIFQACAVMCAGLLFLGGPILSTTIIAALLFNEYHLFVCVYAAWFIFDLNKSSCGGRRIEFIRRLKIW